MKNILCLLTLLFISMHSSAQYENLNSVKLGNDFKGKGKWNNTLFNVVKSDGTIYSIAYRANSTKKVVIDIFDSNMNHEKQYYVDAEKKFMINSGKFINNELILLGIDTKKSIAKTFTVDFGNEELIEKEEIFNLEDLDLTDRASAIQIGGLFSMIALNSAEKKRDIDVYGVFESSVNENFYVYSRDLKSKGNNREKHQIVVLDSEYKQVYTKEIDIAVKDKLMEMLSFNIDDNGNVLVIAKKYEDGKRKEGKRKKRGEKDANYHMEFILVNENQVSVQKVQEDNMFINDLTALVHDGEIFIGSFYSDEKEGRTKGVYSATYSMESLEKINSKKIPLTEEVISQLNGNANARKTARKKKNQDTKLKGHSLLIGADKSVYFLGEEDYIITHSSVNSRGQWSYSYTYVFNDILVTKITPNGELDFFKVISKAQKSQGKYIDIHSFSSYLVDGTLQLFLNSESAEDKKGDLIFKSKKEKKLALFNIQINPAGVLSYKKILDVKKGDNIAMGIKSSKLIDSNGFITKGNDGKTQRFLKVVF